MLGTLTSPGTASGLRLRAAAGAVALGVLIGGLSGCNSNPEPPPLESASAAPSATPTPSAVPPELPAEAKGASKAAAKAFVRHYVEVVNYSMTTGDTQPLRNLHRDRCSTCEAIENRISDVYRQGGRLEGDGWSIQSLEHIPSPRRSTTVIAAGISIAPQTTIETSEAPPSTSPASRGHLDFTLAHTSSGWVVVRLEATQ